MSISQRSLIFITVIFFSKIVQILSTEFENQLKEIFFIFSATTAQYGTRMLFL